MKMKVIRRKTEVKWKRVNMGRKVPMKTLKLKLKR